MNLNAPEITVIGGGTGSFTLLSELKEFTPNINAVVNMSDDGGSTGKLRDELGVLPPGDIRQCLVALSNLPETRELFSYRFGEGAFAGHSLGNIILSALELRYEGDYQRAINMASTMLKITGQVIPVTLENHRLALRDGEEFITGEHLVGHRRINHREARVELTPPAQLNPAADQAIRSSDLVVIAPGNLYGSLLPALAVDGMQPAFKESAAKKVVVTSLVNKPGQTDGWHVVDYVHELERYVGEGQIDTVLYNNEPPPDELLCDYALEDEHPVSIEPERFNEVRARAIGACLVAKEIQLPESNDVLQRTLIRHDARQVGRQLMRMYYD